jgi:16S rRNA (uracil1498-N3)-methyltransferase
MIGSIRLFVEQPLQPGAVIAASPGQAHYLFTVMRRRTGEALRLFNGRDGEFVGRIGAIKRDRAELAVETRLRAQAAEPDLWLAFALLKRDATDLVVEKATELGVAVLLPVITERGNVARSNPERLSAIAIEAAEQSERLTVPTLHPPQRLPDLLARWPDDRRLFVAVERSTAPGLRPSADKAALLVGPEGGFTPAELDLLGRHPIVSMVSLGPRVLRAETAAIAGLALLQAPGCG